MEDFDLSKSFDDLLKPKEAALSTTTEVPDITSLGLILPHLPPEGQAWLNGLNAYCRRAVEHDLRTRCASHSRQLTCNDRKRPPSIVRAGCAKALCRGAKDRSQYRQAAGAAPQRLKRRIRCLSRRQVNRILKLISAGVAGPYISDTTVRYML